MATIDDDSMTMTRIWQLRRAGMPVAEIAAKFAWRFMVGQDAAEEIVRRTLRDMGAVRAHARRCGLDPDAAREREDR